jgi:hypothetical protein
MAVMMNVNTEAFLNLWVIQDHISHITEARTLTLQGTTHHIQWVTIGMALDMMW